MTHHFNMPWDYLEAPVSSRQKLSETKITVDDSHTRARQLIRLIFETRKPCGSQLFSPLNRSELNTHHLVPTFNTILELQ